MATTPKSRGGTKTPSTEGKSVREEVIETRTTTRESTPIVTTRMSESYSTTSSTKPRSFQLSLQSGMGDLGMNSPGHQASAILHRREEERREMEQLNDKFADYIMKVRFLQAQNRKLTGDIDHLASKSGQHNIVKNLFESELNTARDMTNGMGKDLQNSRSKLEALQKDIQKISEK